MSALVWLVKPVQIVRNYWGHLGGLQAGRMRWFIRDTSKDLYKKGDRHSKIPVQFERQVFGSCHTQQCGSGLGLSHFFLAPLVSSPFPLLCTREL